MKKMLKEFEEFINRGNVMDMAVGVIVGGAFTSIVTALTDNIINPLIAALIGGGIDSISGLVVPGTNINFGKFIGAIINFLIVAFIVFLLVKAVNSAEKLAEKAAHHEEEKAAPAPTCPYCLDEVKPGATKCCHCGSDLPHEEPEAEPAEETEPGTEDAE
ncbi:large conductance mechanosensitive channel protein MscL [Paratractidigestivibacter sp.]|uniref:large conductance mechanosensitive channel protein MscL n=1 Tax=Paratractidigestivibacter sp. TaxID=2847316 RepID=UPI002AC91A1B|nr:large conductance mechanosensitive channel protein MscL [Paratractidigestivibacter sp.]